MKWPPLHLFKSKPERQRLLPFLQRRLTRERHFKRLIAAATALALLTLLAGTPKGRLAVEYLVRNTKSFALSALNAPPDRPSIDAAWTRSRQAGIAQTRSRYRSVFASQTPRIQDLLTRFRMAPDTALIRWGNYDRTLMMSSAVFEQDDHGRSYRLRPHTRSIWLTKLTLPEGLAGFFLVPDTPDLRAAIDNAGLTIVPGSQQSTNSWGCRGPEPNLDAAVRILVLGDSFMQGLFIADDQTPPESLRNALQRQLQTTVSVLNTGHLGYSLEQYHATLLEYADPFRPDLVVLSVFPNDFGDGYEVMLGRGDWPEARHWLSLITQFCRTRGIPCLLTPIPTESQITGPRNPGHYPGQIANLFDGTSPSYLDPTDDFVTAHLNLTAGPNAPIRPPTPSPLYNGAINDGHLSPLGATTWAQTVARRITLLLRRYPPQDRLD